MKPRPFWAALLLGACLLAAVFFLFRTDLPDSPAPVPAPVAVGDQEVAFLNPATSGPAWERFVAGLRHLERRMQPSQWEVDTSQAYPRSTADLPAVAVRRAGQPGTLWVRWYKLTGQNSIPVWLDALTQRQPPPLAVVGGGSSDRAKELAQQLHALRQQGRDTPVLLLTTATAEFVDPLPNDPPPLMRIYDQRTFRFCFSNRQMARATLEFLTSQHLVPPHPGLICFLSWKDDPFTQDLANQFRDLLWQQHSDLFRQIEIPHSIGSLTEPNAGERRAVRRLLEELQLIPPDKPVLLVMPGGAVPVRRVLRDLFRTAPAEAQRIVVAVGDAIDFNTVVRDRALSWKIQDVPCPLVLFCHRHPMDFKGPVPQGKQARGSGGDGNPFRAGSPPSIGKHGRLTANAGRRWAEPILREYQPAQRTEPTPPTVAEERTSLCSTQDLLLYADIGHALVQTVFTPQGLRSQPELLAEQLFAARDLHGNPVFQTRQQPPPAETEALAGNRRYEAPKFIVLLRPVRERGQILPVAPLTLFQQDTDGWHEQRQLRLTYDGPDVPAEGSAP